MAAPRYRTLINGVFKLIAAITTSAGAGDAEKIVATNTDGVLDPTLLNATDTSAGAADAAKVVQLNSAGQVDQSMMPTGVGPDTQSAVASEALAAGDLVNLWNNGGALNVRKADATAQGKEADGYVLQAVSASGSALVYADGKITGLSGLTIGARYYLHTTAGAITDTAPSAAGNVVQYVGKAVSATELLFEPEDFTVL